MWKSLRDVLQTTLASQLSSMPGSGGAGGTTSSGAEFVDGLVRSVQRVKETKRLMKEIWEQSKNYRISDRVHMTEIEILQRLRNDGVFPWLDGGQRAAAPNVSLQNLHICFFMRRYDPKKRKLKRNQLSFFLFFRVCLSSDRPEAPLIYIFSFILIILFITFLFIR